MELLNIIDEDFTNYKKPSIFIGAGISCSYKCCKEANIPITTCQNQYLQDNSRINIPINNIVKRYMDNPLTKAIVIGGLEPLDNPKLLDLLFEFRKYTQDTIIIYTGYTEGEASYRYTGWNLITNVIMKFGRFVPGQDPYFDELLGVNLASSNQYSKLIS